MTRTRREEVRAKLQRAEERIEEIPEGVARERRKKIGRREDVVTRTRTEEVKKHQKGLIQEKEGIK